MTRIKLLTFAVVFFLLGVFLDNTSTYLVIKSNPSYINKEQNLMVKKDVEKYGAIGALLSPSVFLTIGLSISIVFMGSLTFLLDEIGHPYINSLAIALYTSGVIKLGAGLSNVMNYYPVILR